MDTVTRVQFYDVIVGVVVVIIVVAIAISGIMGTAVPQYLVDAFLACVGWVLRGGAQAANELIHKDRSVLNDGSATDSAGTAGGSAGGAAGGTGDAV